MSATADALTSLEVAMANPDEFDGPQALADVMQALLDEELVEASTATFAEGGWLTRDTGFTVTTADGQVLGVTVTRLR